MRVVADTNTVISGLLWKGNARQILDLARANRIELFTTAQLLAELEDVLLRDKFARRLESANVTAHDLVLGYAALATVIAPGPIEPVVLADPDDDAVIACAVAAEADAIVSGDSHLLALEQYNEVRILAVAQLVAEVQR